MGATKGSQRTNRQQSGGFFDRHGVGAGHHNHFMFRVLTNHVRKIQKHRITRDFNRNDRVPKPCGGSTVGRPTAQVLVRVKRVGTRMTPKPTPQTVALVAFSRSRKRNLGFGQPCQKPFSVGTKKIVSLP